MRHYFIKNLENTFFPILVLTVTLWITPAIAQGVELKVFAAAGLDKALSELATEFSQNKGTKIAIISGEPNDAWLKKAQQAGDIIVCGAEYQLNQIIGKYPKLIDKSSRASLYPRMSGVLVRKGGSKKIASFSDLSTPGINVMVVDGADQAGLWEDMTTLKQTIAKLQKNIFVSAKSSTEAIEQWNTRKELDAWITFQSWHYYMKDSTRLIKVLDHYKRLRGTPIAIISTSKNKTQAQMFIEFLKSKENLQTYQKWGW